MMMELDWIAADWGTSALRVWAIGRDGAVLAKANSSDGMGRLQPADYEPVLLKLIDAWLPEDRTVPVTICGMAGARQGWSEAAYRFVPCAPVAGASLTSVLTSDPRIEVSIVPGLAQADPPDVMRGEETQLAGLVGKYGSADLTVCLPGTHSKWVKLADGEIAGFTTFMTGEAFALLAQHSILRHSVGAEGEDRTAFLAGVSDMLEKPDRLTAELFGIRAAGLLGDTDPTTSRSRLSGLLIGAELAATRRLWQGRAVHVIGASYLTQTYAMALEHAGARPVMEDVEIVTLAGLSIARSLSRPDGTC